jgi:hypothetical protein
VGDFTADWLALREPVDDRSRSRRIAKAVVKALPTSGTIRVVDLAAGTGSNARFLTPVLPTPQGWLLVDRDATLLARARELLGPGVATRAVDLSRINQLRDVLALRHLVTASALLDLVSDEWLRGVCAFSYEHRAVVLFALSYNGHIVCSPDEPEDDLIRRLVNQHQHTNKGFGPALGPEAVDHASRHLETLGYQVVRDRSDWVLESDAGELQRQLIGGWAQAATEVAPTDAEVISGWRRRRLAHVVHQRSRLVVGHEDLGAFIA